MIQVARRVSCDAYTNPRSKSNPPPSVLQRVGGKDASKQFWKYHNESILKKFQPKLQIGSLDTKKKAAAPPPQAAEKQSSAPAASGEAAKKGKPVDRNAKIAPKEEFDPPLDMFGDLVPYADPNWYQSVCFCDCEADM